MSPFKVWVLALVGSVAAAVTVISVADAAGAFGGWPGWLKFGTGVACGWWCSRFARRMERRAERAIGTDSAKGKVGRG